MPEVVNREWLHVVSRALADFRGRAGIELSGNEEDRARARDALLIHDDVAVREREPVTSLLYVDMRLEPVAGLGGAGEIHRQSRGDEVGRRLGRKSHRIAKSDIGEGRKNAAVEGAPRIAVLCLRSQADDEFGAFAPAVKRADQLEHRAGTEQGAETVREFHSASIYRLVYIKDPALSDLRNRRATLVLLVLSGLIITLCMGLRQSLGIFMSPITLDLGVSAAAFSFSLALQNLVWGLSQPLVGALADRYGARPVLLATAATYAAGLLLMIVSNGPFGLNVAGVLTGIGIAGTGFGVLIGVVARAAPQERRTQTVGAVAAAGSLGTVLIAPMGQHIMDGFGWRASLAAFAGVALVMALLSLAVRETGAAAPGRNAAAAPPQSLGEALREAARHRGFVAMTIAFFACGFQLIFITTHLPQYLELCGIAPSVSATALALIGLFNTVGTLTFGMLGARYSQKRLLALIYLLRSMAIATFLLIPVSAASSLVFAAAMGMLWLGVTPLVTGILGRVFGLGHFNTLYGIMFLSHQIGSFCGAWMGGLAYDLTGSYAFGWTALVVIGALAFVLQWTMDDRPPAKPRAADTPIPAPA